MKDIRSLEIRLWDEVVGYIALSDGGIPIFEYDDNFARCNLELSPLELPVRTTAKFVQNNPSTSFNGLPGIIADCLPDRFGMRVIRDFYNKKVGLEEHEIDVIKQLLYVGNRAIGALEFYPPADDYEANDTLLEMDILRKEVRKTLNGQADKVTAEIMRIGGSAGGARAKALIDFNPSDNTMRSGFAEIMDGYIPSIIKFDGVKDGEEEGVYGRLEYVYWLLAKECDIDSTPAHLLIENSRAHFITERFDRDTSKRKNYHYASLCGLLVKDWFQKHSCSYEEYFQLIRFLTDDNSKIISGFRRMLFNIVFRNQDDHTKNFGFLMDKQGKWDLAPAFDLTYAYSHGSAITHQMKINGKDDDFAYSDLQKCGESFGLSKKQIKFIIEQTCQAAGSFMSLAGKHGLPEDFATGIHSNFRIYKI